MEQGRHTLRSINDPVYPEVMHYCRSSGVKHAVSFAAFSGQLYAL